MPDDEYIDLLHVRAQPSERPPGLWPLGGLLAGLVAAFLFAGPLLRLADATAAVVDIGTVSLILLTVIGVLAFHLVARALRSEEHTSELQSLMRISYAVFCLKKQRTKNKNKTH